jgi:hypothetical protein
MQKKDVEAIDDSHKYFDYNLNFKEKSGGKTVNTVKIHHAALHVAGVKLRMG